MNTEEYKKPDIKVFRKVLARCNGNLTKVSNVLGVNRSTVWKWAKADREFKLAIQDERSKLFDECLVTARTMAMGLPAYENVFDDNGDPVLDENGKQKKVFSGWVERPDGQMVRYLMSHLDRNENFGEFPVMDDSDEIAQNGVPIKAWIMKMNSPEE